MRTEPRLKNRTMWAALLTAAAVVLAGINIAGLPTDGDFGIRTTRSTACTRTVADVATGGPDQPFRVGDVIQDAGMPRAERLRLQFAPRAGDVYSIPITRAGFATTIIATLRWPQYRWFEEISATAVRLIVLLLGFIMLWRGRDWPSFYLGAFFVGLAPAWVTSHYALPMPWAAVASIIASLGQWLSFIGLFLFARDLAKNATPSRTSRVFATMFPFALAFGIGTYVLGLVALISSGCQTIAIYALNNAAVALVTLLPAGMLVSSYLHESGTARVKLRWLTASAVVALSGPFIDALYAAANQPTPLHGALGLSFIAMPLGCAYVTLRHRLIDVSFVINRALIYTSMTTVVIGLFALLERTVEQYALAKSVTVAFQIGVTIAVALSFDRLERYLDALFDRIFFRHKHAVEEALLRLAQEARFVVDGGTLLDRVANDVHAGLGADVGIYEMRDEGYVAVRRTLGSHLPDKLETDDRALVGLRAGETQVRLADTPSAAGSDGLVLPLATGGVLSGAIVVAGRTNAEAYDPDEVLTLRRLASAVAGALDSLRARSRSELLEEIAAGKISPEAARARAQALLHQT